MSDKFSKGVALGILDDARMAADYEIVKTYIGLDDAVRRQDGVHQRVPRPLDQDDEVSERPHEA